MERKVEENSTSVLASEDEGVEVKSRHSVEVGRGGNLYLRDNTKRWMEMAVCGQD